MTVKEKVTQGKPYAGNPRARFDEGALCGTILAAAVAVAGLRMECVAVTNTVVEMSGCETGKLVALPDKAFADFRQLTDKRIAEIRATPNMEIPAGAECRYLSEKGDDDLDGKTSATAWRTTARLDREELPKGAFVLFERGGLFRGGLKASEGVTYTAYGKGAKPRIYSSPANGADPAKWEKTDVENVWRYRIGKADVGTIVFNDGEAHAIKILPIYNDDGTFTQQINISKLDEVRHQKRVRYSRNVIENCDYSIEYFLSMEGNVFIGVRRQRFGVVNQGKPVERAYDENLVSALGERFSANVYSVH